MRTALPLLDALQHAVPGATVVNNRGEKIVFAGRLPERRASEVLQRLACRCDATIQVVECGTDAVEQGGPAEFIGFHRGGLDGSQIDPGLTFAEQLDAELPPPAGQDLFGRQRRPCPAV